MTAPLAPSPTRIVPSTPAGRGPAPGDKRAFAAPAGRSGKRRGGEEGRSRWGPDHLKKKKSEWEVVRALGLDRGGGIEFVRVAQGEDGDVRGSHRSTRGTGQGHQL